MEFDEDKMRRTMYEIELLGSYEVSLEAVPLFFHTAEFWREADIPPAKSNIHEAMMILEKSLFAFNKAVRSELKIPDDPPMRQPEPLGEVAAEQPHSDESSD